MNAVPRCAFVALAALAAACGGSTPPSTSQPPPTSSGVTITGSELLGWTQVGNGADAYVYAVYVDGIRNGLPIAECTASAPGTFDCKSPLPALTQGTHTLQLSAAILSGDTLVEGPKSEPIVVTVSIASTSGVAAIAQGSFPGAGSTQSKSIATATPSCGLAAWDPTHAIAWTTDGQLELVSPDRRTTHVLAWSRESDRNWQVGAIAARVEQGANVVYVALTSPGSSEPRLRVARYREINGVLGERAVLVEGGLPYQSAGATASFGPDGRLFIAFAWSSTSTEERPFVVAVDPDAPAPFVLDARFTAAMAVTGTWDGAGRFWSVEKSGDQYAIRSSDGDQQAFAATSTIVAIVPLAGTVPEQVALFAADGSGWIFTRGNPTTSGFLGKLQVLADGNESFGSATVAGSSIVGCSMTPGLTLTYRRWTDSTVRVLRN